MTDQCAKQLACEFRKLSPPQAMEFLRLVADQAMIDAETLSHSWQDKEAGFIWVMLSTGFEKTENRMADYWKNL
jgi:hypothetical protein